MNTFTGKYLNGLWEQIIVDYGSEFFLTIFIQEKLHQNDGSREILPYVQTPSTQVYVP